MLNITGLITYEIHEFKSKLLSLILFYISYLQLQFKVIV